MNVEKQGHICLEFSKSERNMEIKRDLYLNKLKNRMHNGMIKVITGIRRSGKSYLLFTTFKNFIKL